MPLSLPFSGFTSWKKRTSQREHWLSTTSCASTPASDKALPPGQGSTPTSGVGVLRPQLAALAAPEHAEKSVIAPATRALDRSLEDPARTPDENPASARRDHRSRELNDRVAPERPEPFSRL